MNPWTCAIAQRYGHCLHLTPYRAPQNSVRVRLELPALGGAREDPRPGGAACVHRPPSTMCQPFSNRTHYRAHGARITLTRTTQEGPAQSRGRQCHGRPGSGRAQQKQQGPRPSPWRQMPQTQRRQREGNSRPRPSRAARHGCSSKANTQGPCRAAAHRSSSKMAGGI